VILGLDMMLLRVSGAWMVVELRIVGRVSGPQAARGRLAIGLRVRTAISILDVMSMRDQVAIGRRVLRPRSSGVGSISLGVVIGRHSIKNTCSAPIIRTLPDAPLRKLFVVRPTTSHS
jgi:hypothetical protein